MITDTDTVGSVLVIAKKDLCEKVRRYFSYYKCVVETRINIDGTEPVAEICIDPSKEDVLPFLESAFFDTAEVLIVGETGVRDYEEYWKGTRLARIWVQVKGTRLYNAVSTSVPYDLTISECGISKDSFLFLLDRAY